MAKHVQQLIEIANNISFENSEVNFELLCGLKDAFDLGRKEKMNKQELISFLKDNLSVKVKLEEFYGYKKIQIIILLGDEIISTSENCL